MAKVLVVSLLIALAGCQTTRGSFCEISQPTRLSQAAIAALSDAEVKKILAANRTGQRLCGWRP